MRSCVNPFGRKIVGQILALVWQNSRVEGGLRAMHADGLAVDLPLLGGGAAGSVFSRSVPFFGDLVRVPAYVVRVWLIVWVLSAAGLQR